MTKGLRLSESDIDSVSQGRQFSILCYTLYSFTKTYEFEVYNGTCNVDCVRIGHVV